MTPDSTTGNRRGICSLHRMVRCEVWSVQQKAAGDRWNTVATESNQRDAEHAIERLAKSGERNLRIQVQRAPNGTEMSYRDRQDKSSTEKP